MSKSKILDKNPAFCIAPWTHTYLSPQSERRLCCASRESHQFIRQYIDQDTEGGGVYQPVSLEKHWNSDFIRRIRRQMLKGEKPKECEVCNEQMLNLYTYKKYFNETMFPHKIDSVKANTDESGRTTLKPISFDYRFSNLCDFKCRTCGSQLSSSWEAETLQNLDKGFHKEPWMENEMKKKILHFNKEIVEPEFLQAIRTGQVEEIYWVGGEPLIWPIHWQSMKILIDNNFSKKVFVRYNTNLNRVEQKGVHLFHDLLPHFKGHNVCASIDGCGKIGEFIRTGLNWEKWLANFKTGLSYSKAGQDDMMVMDLTITLPGLFSLKELFDQALKLGCKIYVKIVFDFDSSKVISPFALPQQTLNEILDDLIEYIEPQVTKNTMDLLLTLKNMKTRPSFQEKYPDWSEGFLKGKNFFKALAEIRKDGQDGRLKIEDIYAENPKVLAWWEGNSQ